ncbi:hypothetical protein MIR68_008636 [Amoeboaphelidium protococcarum]|nr:hypothetical protein MIR68_008636 [Amoeboaphelidium protococcarum]
MTNKLAIPSSYFQSISGKVWSTAAVVMAQHCGKQLSSSVDLKAESLHFANGTLDIKDNDVGVIRYIARELYGDAGVKQASDAGVSATSTKSVLNETLTDAWIDFAVKIAGVSGGRAGAQDSKKSVLNDYKSLSPILNDLDMHLKFRAFFVGYEVSAADLVVFALLKASPIWSRVFKDGSAVINVDPKSLVVEDVSDGAQEKGKDKKNKSTDMQFQNLVRWYHHINSLDFVGIALDELSALQKDCQLQLKATQQQQKSKDEKKAQNVGNAAKNLSSGDTLELELPNAVMGKVVTRFPPEPSGYLHIGHVKAALLNYAFAQKYNGKLLIRFDDTNPNKEKQEYETSILEDLATLFESKFDDLRKNVSYTSDWFDTIFDYAKQLIQSGGAYVDNTGVEEMRNNRMHGIASKNRDMSVEESLRIFTEEMVKGTDTGVAYCLRAKMSVDAKNKALRDPVIYRCNTEDAHHRTGRKWNIYPTYDFACPIVDSLEGVTHALRTSEYNDRNEQYYWFIEHLKLQNKPLIWDYSRLNFCYTLLSKRKLNWFVNEKKVDGWDDPRFPTVRGIIRRGLSVEGLRKFIIAQGASRSINLMEWDVIWAFNKQIIDPVSSRHSSLKTDNVVQIEVVDGEGSDQLPQSKEVPRYKKNLSLGTKVLKFSKNVLIDQDDAQLLEDGEEFTLMDWGNVIIRSIQKSPSSSDVISSMKVTLNLAGDFKKTKKINWLSAESQHSKVRVREFDYLITKKKLEEEDDFAQFLNPVTEKDTALIADEDLKNVKKGQFVQLERRGYYVCDVPYSGDGSTVELISVPDGKAASVALKSWGSGQ